MSNLKNQEKHMKKQVIVTIYEEEVVYLDMNHKRLPYKETCFG